MLYVSPHRLLKDLQHIKGVMGGETHAVLMRELTKQFEERIEASVDELIEKYTKSKVKGELVLVVSQQGATRHGGGLVESEEMEDGGGDIAETTTRE